MQIVVLGAGAHGRAVAEKSQVLEHDVLGFLDDTKAPGEQVNGVSVLGGFDMATSDRFGDGVHFHVALGNAAQRVAVSQRLQANDRKLATIIHPNAVIEQPCEIGDGVFITYFTAIGTNSRIGDFVSIHAFVLVAHDAELQTGATIGPKCAISRGAVIGRETFLGAGAVVLPDVKIGAGCTVGAAALVTKDVPDGATVYGAPARRVETAG